MPVASHNAFGVGASIPSLSQIVTGDASPHFHNLCGALFFTGCDIARMESNKNGGPNHLKAWREFRELTQEQLAEAVGTNANMIHYLETGERGLSAKWLRRLAPALKTTPGLLLDHDPNDLDSDMIEAWASSDIQQKRRLSAVAKALIRTGTTG